MRATLRLTVCAVLAMGGLALAGCAQTVALRPAADATNAQCAAVVTRLPAAVANLASRETNAQGTGAWGDPAAVLLRCGVAVPDPTASLSCVTVDGVDWLRDPAKDPVYVFTTYGRNPATEVIVDSRIVDGGAVLTAISPAIAVIPAVRRCVSPDDVLQNGVPVDPTATPTASPKP
jgi:outer membrane murein-binding lipoprotein Lpp